MDALQVRDLIAGVLYASEGFVGEYDEARVEAEELMTAMLEADRKRGIQPPAARHPWEKGPK